MKAKVTPQVMKRIQALTKEGLGPTAIGKRLGMGKSTILRALKEGPPKSTLPKDLQEIDCEEFREHNPNWCDDDPEADLEAAWAEEDADREMGIERHWKED